MQESYAQIGGQGSSRSHGFWQRIHGRNGMAAIPTWLPSGKRLHNYRKSPFLMGKSGKSTISMAIFNSFLYVYQAGYLAEFFASFHGLSNGMPPISWDMTPKTRLSRSCWTQTLTVNDSVSFWEHFWLRNWIRIYHLPRIMGIWNFQSQTLAHSIFTKIHVQFDIPSGNLT